MQGPTRSGARYRRIAPALVALLATSLLAAGCGGSDSSSTSGGGSSTSAATSAPKVDDAAVQATMKQAIGRAPVAGELDPIALQAFEHAAMVLPQDKLDKAFECWQKSTCQMGSGDVTVGVADGFGGNTWRKFTKMELILQALTYPQVGKFIYTDAGGDLAKMQANIRSLSAQGAKVILTYDDFGAAVAPAFAAAQRKGAVVSNFVGPVDTDPKSIAVRVELDFCKAGQAMIDTTAKQLDGKGSVSYFTGTPGNPQGKTWQGCADKQIAAKYPDLKVTFKADTSWTPAGTAKAASAAIASGKPIDAILYDYADPSPAIVTAYEKAGKKAPLIVATSSSNGALLNWDKRQGTPKAYPLYTTVALSYLSRISLTASLDKLAGKSVPDVIQTPLDYIEATKDQVQADKPTDFPGPSVLVPDALAAKMLAGS
jgi:ABC-type sugar transport system substrate-binding protein